jgi:site-specific recombinase XerD
VLEKALTTDAVYKLVRGHAASIGIGIGVHALRRATAVTNALDHNANIAKVQECLGHANIATTWIRAGGRTVRRSRWRTERAM